MSSLSRRAIKAAKTAFPPDSVPGILIRGIYHRSIKHTKNALMLRKHNKAVIHLMNVDVLNERIRYVKDLASLNNISKTFYVISKDGSHYAGLFTFITYIYSQMTYALAKGMIPVIDMQNYPSPYLEDGELGKVNAWEKFFKQPCGWGLNDVIGKYAIYSHDAGVCQTVLPFTNNIRDYELLFDKQLKLWGTIYDNLFILNDNTAQYIEQEYNRLIKPGMRVLGVFYRGETPECQPELEVVVEKVRQLVHEWSCTHIYVTADKRKAVTQFESVFPGKVLSVSRKYYDDNDITHVNGIQEAVSGRFDRDNDAYLRGLEYLSSVIILSRCTCAVMGVCSGTIAALFINGGKYENTHIFSEHKLKYLI